MSAYARTYEHGAGPFDDTVVTRGVLFVHACPRAVAAHLEWALGSALGVAIHLDWADQPVAPGQLRSELVWTGEVGTASLIASALNAFPMIRYEVTEEPADGHPGERYAATPNLGLFRADMGEHGDIMVSEERLRSVLNGSEPAELGEMISRLIGDPWDDELEPFRFAQEGSSVRVLHQVV